MIDDSARRLYLIDGSGFIFRAFHALPPMTRADGTPVNAVMGFVNMLMKLLTDFHAGQIAVIFDASRTNFRNDLYDQYKANRSDTPPELIPQFPLIREAVEAFSLPSLELDGYEADDLIATYTCLARDRGQEVTIVSSDKDLMQLVRDGVEMFDPIKNRTIGRDEVIEKFGVPPEKMIEVQSLIGDSVDNVPGVPGIGPKTAAELILQFGDLETVLEQAHTIKQNKRRESLIQYADQARLSKKLVTLHCGVPVPLTLEQLVVQPFDRDRLIAFCRAQGLKATANRLEGRGYDVPRMPEPELVQVEAALDAPVVANYALVTTPAALEGWIVRARAAGYVSVATVLQGDIPRFATLVGLSLAVAPGEACYIPFGHLAENAPADGTLALEPVPAPDQIDRRVAIEALRPLMADRAVLKLAHNFKIDAQVLGPLGLDVAPFDDTMMLSYVLDGTTHGHSLAELAELFLNHTAVKPVDVTGSGKAKVSIERVGLDKVMPYAAEQADLILRLHGLFKRRLVPERMVSLYETMERPLVKVVAAMERDGIKVDRAVLKDLSVRFEARLAELGAEIQQLAGREFNLGSPKQLGEILFNELKIEGGRKTKTGDWSTDSAILEPLAEAGHTIVAKLLDWRQTAKLKNTYTDALQEEIQSTGRVHTSFSLAATNTGRLSATAPNLQNIPIRTLEGREIRRAFIAEEGHVLLSVDYSQIELRLAAEIAGIKALVDAFRNGDDIHALTASQVFGVPMAEMTADLRRAAKAINFGIIYGISGYGLAQQLGIESRQASLYIKQYLDRFSELREYMEDTKAFCRRTGYVVTLFGRKCHMPGINDSNPARRAGAERQAINARLQGTAADIMRRAMVKVADAIKRENLPARLLLQVHDELVLEVPDGRQDEVAARVKHVMENTVTLGVPLQAEAGHGLNWADAH
jgi:DNA polymerase-1